MAPEANNRYALFREKDLNVPPPNNSAIDLSRNPFLNQVADDSIPWQEVKKRSAVPLQPPLGTKSKTLVIRDSHKIAPARSHGSLTRARALSSSTAATVTSNDKAHDPHENWCGVCSIKFSNKSTLLNHIKQTPEHQHYCNLCKRVFKDRNGLKNHVDSAWDHEVFCNLCLSAFKDEWGLKNHFENNYSVGHEFVCLTCLMGFRSRSELEVHLKTSQKHSCCLTCNRRFRDQDERDEHWQKTSKHKHCLQPGCDFDGPDQMALQQHLKRDHFQCEGCKRILPSATKLNLHYESCEFTIACHQCGEPFAGQVKLAAHLEHCYLCEECGYQTHHQGNYHIHMTKHSNAAIPCWACDAPMRTYSSLINHLESGKCPKFPNTARLLLCLGKWWYSPLYMDLDIHAQIRTGRIALGEVQAWMDGGLLHPFICRADGCTKSFGHLSSLVLHVESHACAWDIERVNIYGLEKEFKRVCVRRDSAVE
ncbi:hypothetical protein P153DRAFT_291076 [Dothidotthia symphoricarpi CBS 119687]|uniref:C2H2-type domain-containing protein n=1 Tax=Dothidotthia symphoricarpi CBS 119687 TaxID=1392245 RepID=A0A6A6AFN3_9PLEO|nr:uncharacterized protein P153DRAFT_291076 [Dothidotthia symphoricarpi CBS 119687]KAF2129211.1 hypothetical protein P153DRAFT_291076 [Dothidotthia symphoricarpi CBS 119687]